MSNWFVRCTSPVCTFLIANTNGDNEGLWTISQATDYFNLAIFNYNVNNNKFTNYLHKIKSKKKVLTASYDKQNNLLYIINSDEIIRLDFKTHKFKIIPININIEQCSCFVDDMKGKLHIICNIEYTSFYYLLNDEQEFIEPIHEFSYWIERPRIDELIMNNKSFWMRIISNSIRSTGHRSHWYQEWFENNIVKRMSGRHSTSGRRKLYKYETIRYDKGHTIYTLGFHEDAIILQYSSNKQYFTVFSDIKAPFLAKRYCVLKQSSKRNTKLLIGYVKMFVEPRMILIPKDVINLINQFYSWYDLHLFGKNRNQKKEFNSIQFNGNHYAISMDTIINNSQKYTGIIIEYHTVDNDIRYQYTIQIKGRIDEFYNRRFPVVKIGNDHNNPTSAQTLFINALKQMFKMFAMNEDKTMSINDMQKYILHCGSAASESRVKSIFKKYGKSESKLNVNGFIDFYANAICDRPDHVMNDFEVLGYNEEELLKPTGECIKGSAEQFLYMNEEVDFNVKVKDDGTKYAVNVTKANAFQEGYM